MNWCIYNWNIRLQSRRRDSITVNGVTWKKCEFVKIWNFVCGEVVSVVPETEDGIVLDIKSDGGI